MGKTKADDPIRASGCVVYRRADGEGAVEVLIAHRPHYDDWDFPKGKLEDGETDQANLRLGEAHWGQTIDVEIRIDYVVDAEPLTRTHKVTITS